MLGYPFGLQNMINSNPQVDPLTGMPVSQVDPFAGMQLPIPPINPMGVDMGPTATAAPPPTIGSRVGQFVGSPQGQAALLAFGNQALQQAMNPQTGGGAGFLNSIQAGLFAHNRKKLEEEEENRKREIMARQKTEWGYEDEYHPLQKKLLEAKVANIGQEDQPYKKWQVLQGSKRTERDGRLYAQDEQVVGFDKDKRPIFQDFGEPYPIHEKTSGGGGAGGAGGIMSKLDKNDYYLLSRGHKIPGVNISPQEAQAILADMQRSPFARQETALRIAMRDPNYELYKDDPKWLQSMVNQILRNLEAIDQPDVLSNEDIDYLEVTKQLGDPTQQIDGHWIDKTFNKGKYKGQTWRNNGRSWTRVK